jgi:hypothetical protein
MLGACFMAMLVPTMVGERPIYDALRENGDEERDAWLRHSRAGGNPAATESRFPPARD